MAQQFSMAFRFLSAAGLRFMSALLLSLMVSSVSAQGLLWQAQRGNLTIFLLGSVHVCDAGCYPFAPTVQQALLASNAVALELDAERTDLASKIEQRGLYPAGQSLRQWLSTEQTTRLSRVLAQQYGKPVDPLYRMRPWLFQTVVTVYAAEKIGLASQLGVDLKLSEMARVQKKPVLELETLDEQLDMLDALGEKNIGEGLAQVIDVLEDTTLSINLNNLVVAWKKSNMERLQAQIHALMTETERHGTFAQAMRQRNRRMVERLVRFAQQYQVLLATVGSAHFFDTGNLLELLQQQGFKIRRLPTEVASLKSAQKPVL